MTDTPHDDSGEDAHAQTRPFADVLVTLNRGRTHAELSEQLQRLVEAVEDTGRAGSITLQVKVSKSKAAGMLELLDTVKVTLPKHDRAVSLFFADDDHNLVREDPRQPPLPLRDVSADPSDRTARKAR